MLEKSKRSLLTRRNETIKENTVMNISNDLWISLTFRCTIFLADFIINCYLFLCKLTQRISKGEY